MGLEIDNRISEAMYVDKANNHVANSDEIVKLTYSDDLPIIAKYINIISAAYFLSKEESLILYHITIHQGLVLNSDNLLILADLTYRTVATVTRIVKQLEKRGFIYTNDNKEIYLRAKFKVNLEKISKAKFFVIEVNPDKTSPKINL